MVLVRLSFVVGLLCCQGSRMLQHIIEAAEKRSELVEIYLHVMSLLIVVSELLQVQVSNEDALGFYKRHDFAVVNRIENYYKVRVLSMQFCYGFVCRE